MKLKALIVDSAAYYRDLLGTILSDIGVDCAIYSSGKAALEVGAHPEYAFIFVSRYIDDMNGELFLHRYREKFSLGGSLPVMITSDVVSEVMLEANKAGFKLVFNKKDINSIQAFLTSVINNRTLNLKGNILFIEDQKSVADVTVALFESYQANIDHVTCLSEVKRDVY